MEAPRLMDGITKALYEMRDLQAHKYTIDYQGDSLKAGDRVVFAYGRSVLKEGVVNDPIEGEKITPGHLKLRSTVSRDIIYVLAAGCIRIPSE